VVLYHRKVAGWQPGVGRKGLCEGLVEIAIGISMSASTSTSISIFISVLMLETSPVA